ncbi:MAG: hypothetical protein BRD48_04375 [Bacteroidetes bacterium QS_9_68_14]|nr:MAG: hypothetical protein BRD48_04375 [Bacteroidetes bacterium QS_9_68_14]
MAFDPNTLIGVLEEENVHYVIIGGAAATAHGSSYPTDDLDILYERSAENYERLAKALSQLNPRLRDAPSGLPLRLDASALGKGFNFTLETDFGNLDLFGEIEGVGRYEDAAAGAAPVTLWRHEGVQIVGLSDLIDAKEAAARPKDKKVLTELYALQSERAKGRAGAQAQDRCPEKHGAGEDPETEAS